MGAWGPGLLANDGALDALSYVGLDAFSDKGMAGRTARQVFDELEAHGWTSGDAEAILGTADAMLDLGVDLSGHADELAPLIAQEMSEEVIGRWREPKDRLAALDRFSRRVKGEAVPEEEIALDNAGLFDRMGKSNAELGA